MAGVSYTRRDRIASIHIDGPNGNALTPALRRELGLRDGERVVTFTGSITVSNGILSLGGAAATTISTITGGITVASGATLQLSPTAAVTYPSTVGTLALSGLG